MKVCLGADHRGFKLKEFLRGWLQGLGHEVIDCGAFELDEKDDYVDYTIKVGRSVVGDVRSTPPIPPLKRGGEKRGIVICGSGVGVCIAANKVKGIRCGLGLNADQVKDARMHDDINVLALAADFVDARQAKTMVEVFLNTKFSGKERHRRRLRKISELERQSTQT
jgi:ribose 5-phosphate isomerase B